MDETAHSPNDATEMAPAFKEFLDTALPMDGGSHTLVLGEDHRTVEHLEWLREHLPQLKDIYGITSIGVESPAFDNPLFWAYQDGTLARELGSMAQAKAYVKAMMIAGSKNHTRYNAEITADLLMDAMDSSVRVIAYDSRNPYQPVQKNWAPHIAELDATFQRVTDEASPEAARQAVRCKAERLQDVVNRNYIDQNAWKIGEIAWLRSLKPEYAEKHDRIEDLLALGHKKIKANKLTSDGLSATLFENMASLSGNRLTLGGVGHINGIGRMDDDKIYAVHGTFGHHLFAVGQAPEVQRGHSVTHAMIAKKA